MSEIALFKIQQINRNSLTVKKATLNRAMSEQQNRFLAVSKEVID